MPAQLVRIEASPDLVEQVHSALLDAISEGSLAPGQRITQEDIAEQLNVSRQPVLQALRLLKKDGFVQDAPGRGVLVSPLQADHLVQIYQVRAALDALAARLAGERRHKLDAKLIEHGRKAARGKNVKAMIEADIAFHDAIYAAAGNPMIAQSARLHWHHIRRAMGAVLQLSQMRESVWDEHEAISRAIALGKAELAEQLMRAHGESASANLAAQILQHTATQLHTETSP